METNRLRQFRVVAETRNLRKAAELLGMSHSALSKSLKVLQKQLGVSLLIQRGRNIDLTADGIEILPRIDELLKTEDQLVKNSAEKSERPFKIATFEVFSTHFLGQLWNQYFPQEGMELRELLPGKLEQAVADGVADVGLTYEPIPYAGVDYLLLGNVEMGIYALDGKYRDQSLSELPFVAPVSPLVGSPSGNKGLDGWPENEIPRKIKFRVDMMESGLSIVRQGLAVIFIPKFVAKFHNNTIAIDYKITRLPQSKEIKAVTRKVYLILRTSSAEDVKFRKFAKMVRQNCFEK